MNITHPYSFKTSSLVIVISLSCNVNADVLDDIAFSALQTELGGNLPSGAGVNVSLVEALVGTDCSSSNLGNCMYLPNTSTGNYTDRSTGLGLSTGFSGHSTGSANNFYGANSSTPDIANLLGTSIDVYAADHWLFQGYLNSSTETTISTLAPLTSSTRVSSHSYVGSSATESLGILQRADFIVDKDEHILVTALNNGATNRELISNAYNSIAVGRTDANHPIGTVDVNLSAGFYNDINRSGPDIVVPESTTSAATPRVASAAALLVGYGHEQGLSKSNGSLVNRNNNTIFHAETSEVIKAVLMAGASRTTNNSAVAANVSNYRSAGNQTTNGLDIRYGAGQLNIQNSYHILAAGEQDIGNILATGFDYDDSFGGLNSSNASASYLFTNADEDAWFSASLVWNIVFDVSDDETFSESVGDLFDLNLSLSIFNGTDFDEVINSNSAIDNTENIWQQLVTGDYRIDVTSNGNFDVDYALAWQTTAVPIPAAIWFLASGIGGLFAFRQKKPFSI